MLRKIVFCLSGLFVAGMASAQEISTADSVLDLEPVVITANKIEQKKEATGKVITVISSDEIRRNLNLSLAEIISRQVGISIGGSNSTPGSVQTVYVRGASAANTLVMLDGVPMYDAGGISSEFDLNAFLPSQIERIEILKGAQSTLYGSDAVAGVINIISKKPVDKKIKVESDFSAASFGTVRASVRAGGNLKGGWNYFAGYSLVNSTGFSSAWDSTGQLAYDNDGLLQHGITAGIGFNPGKRISVQSYFRYNKSHAGIDAGAFTDERDYFYDMNNTVLGMHSEYQPSGNLSVFFNYQRNDYFRNYLNDSGHVGGFSDDPFAFYTIYSKDDYRGVSDFSELYAAWKPGKGFTLMAGTDYRNQSTRQQYLYISNYGPYEPMPLGEDTAKACQFSGFAQLLYARNGFSIGAGGRYNHHSIYGSNQTFSLNPSYTFRKKLKLFVNAGSAFRVPTLYQLFSEFGNRNLKPEYSVSYELGMEYRQGPVSCGLTLFSRNTKDVIAFYTDPVTFAGKYVNEDRQRDHGLEGECIIRFSPAFRVSSNYSYVTGLVETASSAGKDTSFFNLFRRPKHIMNLRADYEYGNWFVGASVRAVSETLEPVYGGSPITLPGYYSMDIHADYRLDPAFRFFADIRNLTNRRYFDQWGYGTAGINFRAGVRADF